jgi:hypothetical protein
MLRQSKASRRFAVGLLVLACAASLLGAARSSAAAEAPSASPALGKYVRIEHRGEKPGAIEIAEVQVFSDGVNIASMGEARQTPGYNIAELAIDGVENGNLYYNLSTAITPNAVGAFWELAFPQSAKIDRLVIYVRPEDVPSQRNNGVWLSVLNADRQVIWEQQMAKAPGGPQFRAEFPVTVLNAANNSVLAAREILTVPTTVGNRPNVRWDVKPAGAADLLTLGFKGGRIEVSGPTVPGQFAVVFGSEAAPFRFNGNALGKAAANTPPAAAEPKDGTLRWRSGENTNWKSAEAVLSPLADGVQMDVTVQWKVNSFSAPVIDLALGNSASPGGEWLRESRVEGTRYKDGKAMAFLAPVTRRKPLIGGHPLRSVKFESPELGSRRLLVTQPASPGRMTLATEADNVTHLYLEPRLVAVGAKHTYSLTLQFPPLPPPEAAGVALPKDRALLQGQFTLTGFGDGGVSLAYSGKNILPRLAGVYTRDGIVTSFDAASWQTAELVRQYQPAGEPEAFGTVVFRARNADIAIEQKAVMGRQDSSGQFLACPFRVETTIEALRPGIRDFHVKTGMERYAIKCKAMEVDDWMETDIRSKVAAGKELLFELKPDKVFGFAGAKVRLNSPDGQFEAAATAQDATATCRPADLPPDGTLPVGKRFTVRCAAAVASLNDYAGPIRVTHPGRRSPFFTLPDAAVVEVNVPAEIGQLTVTATDGESGAVLPEPIKLERKGRAEGDFGPEDVYECRLDRKQPGVTALEFTLTAPGGTAEKRTFEAAHIGRVTAASKVPADLPDEELLDLTPVDAIHCADQNDPHPRLDFPGASDVLDTCIGKCRRIGERGATMIWEITLPPESINQPHLVVAEYPDDARRNMSLNVFEVADQTPAGGAAWNTREYRDGMGTGAQTGWPFPLSRQMKKMSLVWWPAHRTVYVAISCCINPEWYFASVGDAAVKRIAVYRVKGELPAVKPAFEAPGRFIGAHAEDSDLIQSDFRGLADPDEGPGCYFIPDRWSPRYLAKYYNSWRHYAQYLAYAGQNLDASSVHRYSLARYPGANNTYGANYSPGVDNQELLARVFAASGAGQIMNIQASHDLNQRMPQLVEEEEERIAANPQSLEPTVAFINASGQRLVGAHQGSPRLNFLVPEVRRELLGIVEDMARRYEGVPGVLGIGQLAGTWLYPTYSPGGFTAWSAESHLELGYDDRTVFQFERDTGVKVPVEASDPGRYGKRSKWLMTNAKQTWIDWRCKQMFAMADDMRKIAAAHRFPLWFTGYFQTDEYTWFERSALTGGNVRELMKMVGYDPALFSGDARLRGGWTYTECRDTRASARGRNWIGDGLRFNFLDDPAARAALPKGPYTTAYHFNGFRENPFPSRDWVQTRRWRKVLVTRPGGLNLKSGPQYVWPVEGCGARDFVMLMAAGAPPATIMHTWMDCGFGQIPSQDSRRFSLAFRTLPLCVYTTLTGNGLDRNLVVRQGVFEGQTYCFVINPTWSRISAELRFTGKGQALNLVTGEKRSAGSDTALKLDLRPYDFKTWRLEDGAVISGAGADPSAEGLAEVARRLDEAEALLRAWGAALPEQDADRQAVVREVAAGRAKIADRDLRGAILACDGWRLREALQRLLPPPGYAVAAPPVADAATELLLRLDEDAGAVTDSSGKNRKVEGASAPAAGRFGKARDMRQSGFTAEVPEILTAGNSWTFECWVTPTAAWNHMTAVPVAKVGDHLAIRWGHAAWGGMRTLPLLNVELQDGKGMDMKLGVFAPCKPGVWYHLAVVYDKDAPSNQVKVYVNGRLEDFETTADGAPLTAVKNAPPAIAFGQGPALLDAVRVSNKARTLQELGYPADWSSRSWSDRLRE